MDRLAAKYDGELNLYSRNSLKLINDRMRDNSKVLEFGPAHGRLTKHLKCNRHCCVDIVEYNSLTGQNAAKYARKALLGEEEGDIDKYIWVEKLAGEKYDFIIFADVLEHVYDPVGALRKCKDFLAEDGAILISVPNIANNNIILSLLNDEFKYTSIGLLDDTHIRFFTYKTLFNIAEELKYSVSYADYTLGLIGQTELETNYDMFSDKDMSLVDEHLFGSIYQLIFEYRTNGKNHAKINEVPTIYMPICYYSTDGAYSEEKRIECDDVEYDNDVYTARIPIAGFTEDFILRFDPSEGVPIRLELIGVRTDTGDLQLRGANAVLQENNVYYFSTIDPFVELSGDFVNANYIELVYKIYKLNFTELDELIKKKVAILNHEIATRTSEIDQKNSEIDQKNATILQQNKEIALKNKTIEIRDSELNLIKSSRGYKLLEGVRRLYKGK